MGQWQIKNVPPLLGKLLQMGQWLHIGKNATFGLGQYKLIEF
ncbi:CRISPR system precrRNA processing endoribonuclease RAMP protein Cas6 [Acinetobacter baumannii]